MTTGILAVVAVVMVLLGFLLATTRKQKPFKPSEQYELELDSQRSTIDFQRKEISRLEKLNADQDRQIRELLKSGASLADVEQYSRTKKEYDAMKTDVDKIALFLREHMKEEIASGKHAGMSLAEVCVMYMRRGKMMKESVQ